MSNSTVLAGTALGRRDDAVRVAVCAPPVDGKANAAVIELVASVLGVRRGSVRLCAGQSSRDKVLLVDASRGAAESVMGKMT